MELDRGQFLEALVFKLFAQLDEPGVNSDQVDQFAFCFGPVFVLVMLPAGVKLASLLK